MKDFIRLTDLQSNDVYDIFNIADEIIEGRYNGFLKGSSAVLFFASRRVGGFQGMSGHEGSDGYGESKCCPEPLSAVLPRGRGV